MKPLRLDLIAENSREIIFVGNLPDEFKHIPKHIKGTIKINDKIIDFSSDVVEL